MRLTLTRAWRSMALLLLSTALTACATATDPRDPLEPMNRGVYEFNEGLDKVVLKPVAKGYKAVVPSPLRAGVTNVFGNFADVTTAINGVLQGNLSTAASDFGRIAINSTVGFFGVFDVASRLGMQKHRKDFGQTLGKWGVQNGPYLVLPLLGPSTFRDAVGWLGDYFTDPEFYLVTQSPETWIVFGTRVINVRANLLDTERVLDLAAIDKYAFLRDAYLQRRESMLFDIDAASFNITPSTGPHRKTLEEMEKELELDVEKPQ
jgi:phospholipid-binding lipoprotein MlaA